MSEANENAPAIEFRVEEGIGIATMARPRQHNPFTAEFLACIEEITAEVKGRNDIDALILTGADGAFCAGGNVKGMGERQDSGPTPVEDMRERLYGVHDWLQPLRNLNVPVIAAVDGPAYGGGFGLVLCADFVLASERARFCSAFGRIGLIPDCALLFTLPRMVGMQRAKEIVYTGRPVSALEAREIGIVMEIHPSADLTAAALTLARRMQQGSRAAFGLTKRIVNQSFDIDAGGLIEMEAAGQAICLSSAYHADAVGRFKAKQPLKFNWEAVEAA